MPERQPRPSAEGTAWLPDFCRLPTLFTSLAATQLAVLVIGLAPLQRPPWSALAVFVTSLFALWLALCSVVLLCKCRRWLSRGPKLVGALLAWLLPVLVSWLGSLLVHELDHSLNFGFAPPLSQGERFAGHNALIAGLLGAALLRYFYVQDQWMAEIQAQARAQVEALQARIRPHFLFNSMNTIASLIRRDPERAERVVENLADLFRAALGSETRPHDLAAELELCRHYLDIERIRLGERLRVAFEIGAEVPGELPFPRLLLQPLVENAVHHGIARLAEGGEVRLQLRCQGGRLELLLTNPCPPRPAEAGNQHAQNSVLQRLRFHFGSNVRMTRTLKDGYYYCQLSWPLPSA